VADGGRVPVAGWTLSWQPRIAARTRIQRDPGINETRPRTITRHEGRKSVTGSDKLPLDLWRQPYEH